MRYYVEKDKTFNNFKKLNNYIYSRNLNGLGRIGFEKENRITYKQELLALKYDAVSFNIFSAISTYYMAQEKGISEEMSLILTQASNNFLQSAYDVTYQLLRVVSLSKQEAKVYLQDINKRISFERKFNLNGKGLVWDKKVVGYVEILNEYYKNTLRYLRTENNYIKHSGQVSAFEQDNEATFYQFQISDLFNSENVEDMLDKVKINQEPIYNEKSFNIENLKTALVIAIDQLIEIVDNIMFDITDDSYKELVRLSKEIYQKRD
ncbi:hypothetical protein QNJ25_03695 [Macrococcus caseolyticus]|uniref:hypothetical protein n=1 Tax=Macrococcoides caseolyticum TaxID=69966 RepID=UPI0024BCCC5E|nr:hypothetical protein [Macrococcus caseolyticus]MDJ1153021.1 hypothetical protein [Macrococcus caseolyticus]